MNPGGTGPRAVAHSPPARKLLTALWLVAFAGIPPGAAPGEAPSTASLAIEIQDSSGSPLPGARVHLARDRAAEEQAWSLELQAGPDGRVLMTGLEPGRYRVAASAEGHLDEAVTVVLRPRVDEEKIVVVLPAGVIFQGTVVSPDGKPIPRAKACLRLEPPHGGPPAEGGARTCRTSDANGVVRFPVLPQGRVRVELEAEDLTPLREDLELSGPRVTRKWVLKQGGAVAGWVVDEDHRAVQGAQVVLTDLVRGGSREGVTDAEGRFLVKGLLPGNWRARIEAPDAMVRVFDGFVVQDGRVTELANLAVRRGAALAGTVLAPDGTGLAAARLRVHERSRTRRVLRSTESDEQGSFRLPGLPPEPVDLLVLPPEGYVAQWIEQLEPPRDDLSLEIQEAGRVRGVVKVLAGELPAPIRVVAEIPSGGRHLPGVKRPSTDDVDPQTGEFVLDGVQPGERIAVWAEAAGYLGPQEAVAVDPGEESGPVELLLQRGEAVGGRVVDRAGSPVSQARIASKSGASTLTDSLGEFVLEGLRPEMQSITASHPEFAPASLRVPVPLAEGESLVFELGPGGSISGQVTQVDEAPVEGATLRLLQPARQAFTGPEGRYRFDRVPRGTRDLELSGPSGVEKRRVELAEGQEFELNFRLGAVLEGRIERAGAPVTYSAVSLTMPVSWQDDAGAEYTGRRGFTDADGKYRISGVHAGWGTFVVQYRDQRIQRPVEIPEGRSPRLDLMLPSGELTGRVIAGKDERPLPGVSVHVRMDAPPGVPSSSASWGLGQTDALGQRISYWITTEHTVETRTDADGNFTLLAPESGRVSLYAAAPGYEGSSRDLELPASGPIELRLERRLQLDVRLQDAQGRPVAGASVCAHSPSHSMCSSEDDSDVRITVYEGTYTLTAGARGFATRVLRDLEADFEAAEEGAAEMTLTLHPGAPLHVRMPRSPGCTERLVSLTGPDGADYADVLVDRKASETDPEALWVTKPLTPGEWMIAVDPCEDQGTSRPIVKIVTVTAGAPVEVTLP